AALAWIAAFHAAPAVSARRSTAPLFAVADAYGAPVVAAAGLGRAHGLGPPVRKLADAGEAIAVLDGACASVIVPLGLLPELERARRGRFVVLGLTDHLAVATACAKINGPNLDPLRDTLLDRLPHGWGKPTDARFDGALHLRAVDAPDRVARASARGIAAAFAFEVVGPVADEPVAIRVEGCRRTVTVERALPVAPAALRPGDVVVQRVRIPLADLPPCRYRIAVAWGGTPPAVVKAFELR
ncbi:MAG: hypothetical protein KIT31_35895, partial [Deltaproteobacteria bacterium]|nr:hypothetical protein [Deltaproteobacteria bacterium]